METENPEPLLPPRAIYSEQVIIGRLLLPDNSADFDNVADLISTQMFYQYDHRIIFQAIADLYQDGKPFDAINVAELLEQRGEIGETGGIRQMIDLAEFSNQAANDDLTAYAHGVRNSFIKRKLIATCADISQKAYGADGSGMPADELQDYAETAILQIGDELAHGESGPQHIADTTPAILDHLEAIKNKTITPGLPVGFDALDKVLNGGLRTGLYLIAGIPGTGKTALAMNIASNVILNSDPGPVLVFSMEMTDADLMARMYSSQANVALGSVLNGDVDSDQWQRITDAAEQFRDAPLIIDETPSLTPNDIRARARRVNRELPLRAIVVDYLQLMRSTERAENRNQEITKIAQSLRALAKEMRLPVIALSQLNRGYANRADKRPVLSDLRESGALEQEADVIAFIYRDEMFATDDNPTPEQFANTAEILFRKNRQGATGMARLAWDGHLTKFRTYIADEFAHLDASAAPDSHYTDEY